MRDALGGMAAVLLGIAAFFVFAGWWVLIPDNIAWLALRDRAMHTLGWFSYRDGPWGIPPGDSPDLGLELANSIGLVDGLPLFAIPFKLLSPWLPRPFQYWGYWWLTCFVLQALFAYRFARELNARRLVAVLAAGFAVLTPAFLARLPLHMALAGHWTILAALYLYARRDPPRPWTWPLLLGVTAAIHAYLLAMVLALYAASWLQRLWRQRFTGLAGWLEPIGAGLVVITVMWGVGFFYTGSLGSDGFGYYRLNLVGFVISHGWSQLVPPLLHSSYDYEGLSFLGIGIFGALALTILSGSIVDLRRLLRSRWLPLLLACLVCGVFALSNVVGLLNRQAEAIPLPHLLETIGNTFRSTGRFVWPMLYLVTLGAVIVGARRLPNRLAVAALGLLLVAQIVDSRAAWGDFRRDVPPPASVWQTGLTSPFWARAVDAGFDRIRAVRTRRRIMGWRDFEYFAYQHHIRTDIVYLGRTDDIALQSLYAGEQQALAAGELEPKTIYIMSNANARRAAERLRPDDLLAIIDGYVVYARHGAALVEGLGISPQAGTDLKPWVPAALQQLVDL